MKPKVLFTDGEGPIVFKDLAADLAQKAVPGLFPILSFYDDYLAEVGTEGYQAGDTLALIVPHLLLHGVTDEDVEKEARDAKVCLGVEEYIQGLQKDGWEIRIISTAYSQLWKLVGEQYLGISMQHIASTDLDLGRLRGRFESNRFYSAVSESEREILGLAPLAQEAMQSVDTGENIVSVFGSEKYAPLKNALDGFYWKRLKENGYKTLQEVQVMGGKRKIQAAQRFANELGIKLSDVPYVGDSITDDALNAQLLIEGGLPIAINGNYYALRNARVAVATEDMRDLRPVVDAWQIGGHEGVCRLVESQSISSMTGGKEGAPIHEVVSSRKYAIVDPTDREEFGRIVAISKESRKKVRGAATARLG